MATFDKLTSEQGRLKLSSLYNEDLAPVPRQRRSWGTYNYAALWTAMSVNSIEMLAFNPQLKFARSVAGIFAALKQGHHHDLYLDGRRREE